MTPAAMVRAAPGMSLSAAKATHAGAAADPAAAGGFW